MKARIRTLLAAAAVVFGFATHSQGQTGPIHRGIIYDHTGAPMPGAVVTFSHPQDSAVRVAVTDQWGEYAVRALDPRTRYVVEISHPAYRTARMQTSPASYINVRLKPRRPYRDGNRPAELVASR
jgi:hypothetical protein